MVKSPGFKILIVDDEPHARLGVNVALKSVGFTNTAECGDGAEVPSIIESEEVGIVLLDLIMPGVSGLDLLGEISQRFPEVIVIMITGNNELDTAVECMREGAFDYILKPVDERRLTTTVSRAVDVYELRRENALMKRRFLDDPDLDQPEAFSEIITRNKKMRALFQYCEAIAPGRQPILITGETGVGKELFARAVHRLSGRGGQFVPLNIAGLDANMISDTLFGHVKGAFTGADGYREGMVEKAANGTLFLDEIGDLDAESQVKLLRLLQEHEYTPLGSDATKISDARVVLATNQNLVEMINQKTFRRDLYYRLQTHCVDIPPLRERLDDLPALINHFLVEEARELGKNKPSWPHELFSLLKNYSFPGNVRELKAMACDAAASHKSGILSMRTFRSHIEKTRDAIGGDRALAPPSDHGSHEDAIAFPAELPTLKEVAKALIREAMKRADGNQSVAAGFLGVSQQALSQRLRKMNS